MRIPSSLGAKAAALLSRMGSLPLLSLISPASARAPAEAELSGFRAAQALAYRCATDIGGELKEGWTERQAAALMDVHLRDHGVRAFFHRSFAWFGDRTRFQGFRGWWDFLPSERRLELGDAVILDTAPIVDGYVGDIGYSLSLKPHAGLDKARSDLLDLRALLPGLFAAGLSAREIWERVDRRFSELGYDNCHAMYPFSVLGHRVHTVPLGGLPGLSSPFGLHSYWAFLTRGLFPELLGPHHEGETVGLWAIEPHMGGNGFGAKFEEILVVEKKRAYWLSDDVPHLHAKTGVTAKQKAAQRPRRRAKIAVITGAASGIGLALAAEYARRGVKVVGLDLDAARCKKLSAELSKEGVPPVFHPVDVSDEGSLADAAERLAKEVGRPDVWINNAGIAVLGSFDKVSPRDFDRVLAVNLGGIVYGTRAALKIMRRPAAGTIVNIASVAGSVPAPFLSSYVAAKHAVVGFTRALQAEADLAHSGVRIVLVSPGFAKTGMLDGHEGFGVPSWLDWLVANPDEVAIEIIEGISSGALEISPTVHGKLMLGMQRAAPGLAGKFSRILVASTWKELLGLSPIRK